MNIIALVQTVETQFSRLREATSFIAPLLVRIFLAPIFIYAGYGKLQLGAEGISFWQRFLPDPNVVKWFRHPEWGLGLPAPELMAFLAGWTEFLGGWLLLIGLFTRYISIPLLFTMIVAAVTAHWQYGWHALPEKKLMVPWEWEQERIEQIIERRDALREVIQEQPNSSWFTEYGSVTILKNGIEFAATYFLFLLTLLFMGAGKYLSVDYWIARRWGIP